MAEAPKAAAEPAPTPAAEPSAKPQALFSPAGYIVVLGLLGLVAAFTYFITKFMSQAKPPEVSLEKGFKKIDLGSPFKISISTGDAGGFSKTFSVEIVLQLNPSFHDLEHLAVNLEDRKPLLRDHVYGVLLSKKSDYFSRPGFEIDLKREIKDTLNARLAEMGAGKDVIIAVLYNSIQRPE